MKKIFTRFVVALACTSLTLFSCKKNHQTVSQGYTETEEPVYTSQSAFYQGILEVVSAINQRNIVAYLDTMPNGFPNINGARIPLAQIGSGILQKLQSDQVSSAVYDIFHFDGQTFSLISYLYKAYLAGNITAQQFTDIAILIPLPPIPQPGFTPPVKAVPAVAVPVNCCDVCNPSIRIWVTMVYKPACGNYEESYTGIAANNTLNNMSSGKTYRFDAEVKNCPCPGTWEASVEAPPGSSYGAGISNKGKTVMLTAISSGTYKVTFTYTVCGNKISKTFTVTVK